MSSMCSNASSKTSTALPDRFIDEHLLEMFPLFDQAWLQLVNIMYPAAMLLPRLVVYRIQVRFRFRSGLLAGHRAGAMKSDVSQVNSCTVSRVLCIGGSVVLLKSKEVARQVANGWQLLMKQDISIILAIHLCTLINEEQVGMPRTAHSN